MCVSVIDSTEGGEELGQAASDSCIKSFNTSTISSDTASATSHPTTMKSKEKFEALLINNIFFPIFSPINYSRITALDVEWEKTCYGNGRHVGLRLNHTFSQGLDLKNLWSRLGSGFRWLASSTNRRCQCLYNQVQLPLQDTCRQGPGNTVTQDCTAGKGRWKAAWRHIYHQHPCSNCLHQCQV